MFKNPHNHDVVPAESPLLNVQIDGQWVKLPKGLNVVEAARRHGKFIPHYCYHPKLSVVGNCRMCLFEMGTPKMDANRQPIVAADGMPEINWMARPQIGCATLITEGMGIRTDSPLVRECRNGVMEFLLINHPLDCPICDQAGECKLQEFSVDYGNAGSRFVENKVTKPKRVDIGERIVLDDERCIMCSRCVRFAKEILDDDVLGFTERGSHTTLSIHPDKRFDNNYSLNTVDICPVGALTSKDFRFKMRVWFLKETKSICAGCATGCNILIGSREDTVYRLTPRENEAVNSFWMCDQGRLGFHYIHDEKRLSEPLAQIGQTRMSIPWSELLGQVAAALKKYRSDQIAMIVSARLTNEELFLLSQIKNALGGSAMLCDVVPRVGQADGLLRSADLNPNTAGARLMGLSNAGVSLPKIREAIVSGKIKALWLVHEDSADAGVTQADLEYLELLVVQGISAGEAAPKAHFVLPGASFAEKRGTMINAAGRIQRLNKAIECPGKAREDIEILAEILHLLSAKPALASVQEVFRAMAAEHDILENLSFSKIGDLGVELPSLALAKT
jgi:NADH-quinone oxidoreductase subunit G